MMTLCRLLLRLLRLLPSTLPMLKQQQVPPARPHLIAADTVPLQIARQQSLRKPRLVQQSVRLQRPNTVKTAPC